jgi:hypothetical protein
MDEPAAFAGPVLRCRLMLYGEALRSIIPEKGRHRFARDVL